jgi:hypothetical protein
MAKHVNLRSLRVSITLIYIFISASSFGQSAVIDSVVINDEINAFSQDRSGNIFISFKEGGITKYSPALDSIISYSPTKLGDITLLEAWHGFQIFSFYEDFQEYVLLDRFLTRDTRYPLSQSSSNYVDICTISSDQNLWVFEENQLRLAKINLNIREIEVEIPLEFIINANDHNIAYLREYQNLVFLVDNISGIYVFDNLGNYLRKINGSGINYCAFYKDDIYYLADNKIYINNLYKEGHQTIDLAPGQYRGVLPLGSNSLLIIKQHSLVKLSLKEE